MAYKAQPTEDLESQGINELLSRVEKLLDEGKPQKAQETIERSRLKSEAVTNAMGVCLLRMGDAERARDLFRRLVAGPGGVTLRADAALAFKTNFATALLLTGGTSACLDVIAEIRGQDDPAVRRLLSAIEKWKKGFSLWQKIKWYTGDIPNHPVTLDFPLGSLK